METVPLVMRTIRSEMRRSVRGELSVPQFRTLIFVNRHFGASLSDLADHIGLKLPTVSKMVDGLVERNLIIRRQDADDRRKITLALSVRGKTSLQAAYKITRTQLAKSLTTLSDEQEKEVIRGLGILQGIFVSSRDKTGK